MIIKTENLTKQYQKVTSVDFFHRTKQTIAAVKNVSLQINQGDHVGLVGLNGSGKSTLIKMILGILQPNEGKITTFGVNPVDNRQINARKIGVVFGQRSQLRWDLPVMDTLLLNRELYQVDHKDFHSRLNQLTKTLGAEDFLSQPVRTLSLGQRMKAEFIAALIHDPELIILDEPTIGLDVLTKNSLIAFLKRLTNKTIIFTSHDLIEVEQTCSRIMIMNAGNLVLNLDSAKIANLAVPATITFTSSSSNYADLRQTWPQLMQLTNGDFQLADIEQKNIKEILSQLTASVPIENIEVKNNKLEYLLSRIAGGNAHEI
ncbi:MULTISPECIES: ABC transporter ATP-binding protein [Lactobacillus]|uniref:ABC transporter ATP-binding protein n=1 Tax=Lactobacillus TaxID=1578 RepID=UPI001C6952CC|nr:MULTISPECIES: ATP-binding cassette domain-containing protein [Lactobacillus]MCX8721483.1 ATP-binding cassette domain-containing protein [Lactobacillus sp. B4010]MCX8733157.1 ATP-binding cassette domain-containing protein [Lactobacillus sp. B4015]MCX8735278.1 ATP-binding cassette domain-containing protein [Lactobacillus sp. B4012]QYN55713.1 ATP-binding cassette domain-containing protein [Lactobacillus panisapium]